MRNGNAFQLVRHMANQLQQLENKIEEGVEIGEKYA